MIAARTASTLAAAAQQDSRTDRRQGDADAVGTTNSRPVRELLASTVRELVASTVRELVASTVRPPRGLPKR